MDWQPIETAPKDGTRILGYVSSKPDEANVCEIWWEPDYTPGDLGQRIGGWDDHWDLGHHPTHWMPLNKQRMRAGGGAHSWRYPRFLFQGLCALHCNLLKRQASAPALGGSYKLHIVSRWI